MRVIETKRPEGFVPFVVACQCGARFEVDRAEDVQAREVVLSLSTYITGADYFVTCPECGTRHEDHSSAEVRRAAWARYLAARNRRRAARRERRWWRRAWRWCAGGYGRPA